MSVRWRLALVCLAALGLGAQVAGARFGTANTAPASRKMLPDPVPAWGPDYVDNGAAPASVTIGFRLYLAGRAPRAERRFANQVAEPGSPRFRRYLTPSQFARRFGPTQDQISTVSRWASSQGLAVTGSNEHYLSLRGTAPEIDKALQTTIDDYGGTRAKPRGYAPVTGISVPAAIGPDVLSAVGLDNYSFGSAQDHGASPSDPSRSTAKVSCSSWWGEHRQAIPRAYGRSLAPTANCGYTPSQLRSAYGVGRYTGRGASVAIVLDGHLGTMSSDANRFFAAHHVAGFARGQFTQNFAPGFSRSCGTFADLPEEPLDVESVHIIAPSARVVYVAVNCSDTSTQPEVNFLDAETRIVDQHLADVETDSYSTLESGYTPAMVAAWSKVFEQGAIEGIGFNFDSGDGGDDTNNDASTPAQITFPASDPWATAVGGTALEIGRSGRVTGELGWGDTIARENRSGTAYLQSPPGIFGQGSTGGRSELFGQPAYQRGVVPNSLATDHARLPAGRVTPDISADADPLTGWLIAYTQGGRYQQIVEGGTSGSSPIVAALEADAKEASGRAVGFANPMLYRLRSGIRDILPSPQPAIALAPASDCYNGAAGSGPCLVTLGLDSSLREAPGFDAVTGLGAATAGLVRAMARP